MTDQLQQERPRKKAQVPDTAMPWTLLTQSTQSITGVPPRVFGWAAGRVSRKRQKEGHPSISSTLSSPSRLTGMLSVKGESATLAY